MYKTPKFVLTPVPTISEWYPTWIFVYIEYKSIIHWSQHGEQHVSDL